MTWRSVILGLLGATLISGLCYFNDWVLHQTFLVGNAMPPSIYGTLIIVTCLVNPLLQKWRLRGSELAVIMAITLAAASIPGGGLVRSMVPALLIPHHVQKTNPGWRAADIVGQIPKHMMADPSVDEETVIHGFVQGLGKGADHISPARVPWRGWTRTLAYWGTLVIALWTALLGIGLVIHRQWVSHEHLPYPIARFTMALFPDRKSNVPSIFQNKLFWLGAALILALHLNNFAHAWFPDVVIPVTRRLDFRAFTRTFPMLRSGGGGEMFNPFIYNIVIAIVYFIPSDASFSLGIGPYVWCVLAGILAKYGFKLDAPIEGTGYFALNPRAFILFGSHMAILATILYTGRNYYLQVAKRAFFLKSSQEIESDAVHGLRLFVVCSIILFCLLWASGIDPVIAIPYLFITYTIFIVLTRINAETGQIYLKAYYWPCAILWGFLGAQTLGPRQFLILMLISTVLVIDPREAILPFFANSLKVLDATKVKLGRMTFWCALAIVLALCISLPATLWIKYDIGNATNDHWATVVAPPVAFNNALLLQRKMTSQGLPIQETGSVISRLKYLAPNKTCVGMAVIGFALVVVTSAARLRFPGFPLHPLIFVTWAATPLRTMGFSYLIGWAIKATITKYGGSKAYNSFKPFMLGVIAGEIFGALIPSIIGLIYFIITRQMPKSFNVIPG